jgi:RimJ/RimL family protein N-acetyltransferase
MSKIITKKYFLKDRTTVTFRPAQIKDAVSLLKLNKEIIREGPYMLHEIDEYKATVNSERNQVRKLNKSPSKIYIVAEVNNKVIGYLTFQNGSLRRNVHAGFLSMFIKKNYRGKGIGRLLLSELIKWAELNPTVEKLSLAVFSNNSRAIALYKKMGFIQEGRCPKDMKIGGKYVDSLLMYKFV